MTALHFAASEGFADDAEENTDEIYIPMSSVSITGLPHCNLWFADDVDLLRGSEEELQRPTDRLEKTAVGYGMEFSSDNSKILVNSTKQRPSTTVWMNGKPLEEVD